MLIRAFLLVSLGAASLSMARADDWTQWRGPKRDGKSAEKGFGPWPKDGPKLLWSAEKLGTGYGSPAVVGDTLYLLGGDSPKDIAPEHVVALNVKDGKEKWRTTINASPTGPDNLKKMFSTWGAGTRATPTVDGDFLYVLSSTGDVACMARADGKLVWTKNLVKDFEGGVPTWGYSESVLIDGDALVCTPGGKGGMVALNKKTGAVIWQCKEIGEGAGYSSIIAADIHGVRQYIQQTMAHGIGVRAKDGKLLWKAGEIARRVAVIPTPVVADNHVFFTSGYNAGCELYKLEADGDGTKAEKVYSKNSVVANHHGGVIELGGYIYGHSDSKSWVCFDYKKGDDTPVWSSNKLDKGSIVYADGHFYCYGQAKGVLVKIKATTEGWEEVGRFTIPKTSSIRPSQGLVWTHPVIANGKLYLRDYDLLYCYDLGQPGA